MSGDDPFNATTAGAEDARAKRTPVPTARFVYRGSAGIAHEAVKVITQGTTRIGRVRGEGTLPLEHDPLASREHALLHASGSELVVEDQQSRNGVFVNGQRVARQTLEEHDRKRLFNRFRGHALVFATSGPMLAARRVRAQPWSFLANRHETL